MVEDLVKLTNAAGLKVVGHIPQGIDAIEYAKFGVSSIEHVSVLVRALSQRKTNPLNMIQAIGLLDGKYIDDLALAMKSNGVAFSPNLLLISNSRSKANINIEVIIAFKQHF